MFRTQKTIGSTINQLALDAHENLLKIIIRSTVEMFLSSEQPVYIIDQSSWDAYIEHYLRERGWGSIETEDVQFFNIRI